MLWVLTKREAYIALLLLAAAFVCSAQAQPPGTVLISRNNDEALNTAPGTWNHLAIFVGNGNVVEAQTGEFGEGVLLTPLKDYVARDYQLAVLYPVDPERGERAAAKAKTLVGTPYRKLGGGARGSKRGLNCVGLVVAAYDEKQRKFRIPDHALLHPELFTGTPPDSEPMRPD